MSSKKNTKLLFEGWRKFLSESEISEEQMSKVVRVFDFDGTLFQVPLDKEPLKNPFFFLMLNHEGRRKYFSKLGDTSSYIKQRVASLLEPSSHIISRISSFGEPKSPEYLVALIQKNDKPFEKFLEACGISADEQSIKKYFRKAPNSSDAKKEFIIDVLGEANVNPENVHIAGNKAENSKAVFAEKIASQNPDTKFEVYGDDELDVAKMRNGLVAGGAKEVAENIVTGESITPKK